MKKNFVSMCEVMNQKEYNVGTVEVTDSVLILTNRLSKPASK